MLKFLSFYPHIRRFIAEKNRLIEWYADSVDALTAKIETLEEDLQEADETIAHLTKDNNALRRELTTQEAR